MADERAATDERVIEELQTLHAATDLEGPGLVNGAALAHLVWHLANIVRIQSGGRYRLAVVDANGREVEPIDLKRDRAIASTEHDTMVS